MINQKFKIKCNQHNWARIIFVTKGNNHKVQNWSDIHKQRMQKHCVYQPIRLEKAIQTAQSNRKIS